MDLLAFWGFLLSYMLKVNNFKIVLQFEIYKYFWHFLFYVSFLCPVRETIPPFPVKHAAANIGV